MKNRETVCNTADKSNSKKILKEKGIQLSRSDIYDRPFAELLPSEKAAVMKALYDPK